MEKVCVSIVETEVCDLMIIANDRAVIGITPVLQGACENENEISADAAKQIREYMSNIRMDFDFPVELHGTPFQIKVWNMLRQIPYGHAVSYREIAERIGRPKAARAVGQAIGRNPCLIVVPCHRVLGKNGSLTGFSAGMELKKCLLRIEKIEYSA